MIRVPGKAALALLQAISAAFVVSSRDGHAQDRPGGRAQSMPTLAAAWTVGRDFVAALAGSVLGAVLADGLNGSDAQRNSAMAPRV